MAGTVRKPQAWVVVASGKVNVLECHVTLVRGEQASTFEATMALDDPSNPGPGFWLGTAPMPASIIGTDGTNTATLITGSIVIVEVDFTERVVRIEGEDNVQDFVASRSDQAWPNITNLAVVQQIAAKHGYSVYSSGSTQTAGRTYDNQDWRMNSDYENDWDIVCHCAEEDGCVAFLDSVTKTLYYVPPGQPVAGGNYSVVYTPPTPDTYETGSVVHLQCKRDIQIGEGVSGTVASWNTRDKKAYVAGSG